MLISCNTCGKQLAATADTCPSCGAKNTFVHPKIQDFLNKSDSLNIEKFDCQHNSHVLQGKRDKQMIGLNIMGIGVIGLGIGFFTFSLLSALGLIAMLVGLAIQLFSKSPEFVVDFSTDPPRWETNDEDFWKPVKTALGIS